MSTFQVRDLPAKATLDGSELIELQEAAGGAGSSKQAPAGAFLPPDCISGLKMVWNSANSLSVTSGAAYISSLGRVVRLDAAVNLAGLVLTASTWYHLYLYLNAGASAVECVTTAPAAPYYGTARAKTGDASRRYIGSLKTDGSGNVFNFIVSAGGLVIYRVKTSFTPFRSLANGQATTSTAVDLSSTVPITASVAYIIPTNQDSSLGVNLTSSDSSEATAEVFFQSSGSTGMSRPPTLMHLNESQQFLYSYPSAPTGGFFVDVWGYIFER